MTSRILLVATTVAVYLISFSSGLGQSVRFDAPGFLEGRDVSTAEFQALHPREKLVEFALELSTDFGMANHGNGSAIMLRLHTSESGVTIVDYGPRTMLESEIDGTISVEKVDETSASIGLQANSGVSLPLNLNANVGTGGKNAQSVKFKKKPEQQLSISSGIWDRGTGLFIKIHKTSQQPLDGMHPIHLTCRMPGEWRAGFLRLECEAISRKESRLSDASFASIGKRVFLIPLLIEGDEEARLRARAIHQAESTLRAAANASIDRSKPDNLWEEMTRWGQPEKKPYANAPWLDRVTSTVSVSNSAAERNLPRAVAIALKDYSHHKQVFGDLRQPRVAEKTISKDDAATAIGKK